MVTLCSALRFSRSLATASCVLMYVIALRVWNDSCARRQARVRVGECAHDLPTCVEGKWRVPLPALTALLPTCGRCDWIWMFSFLRSSTIGSTGQHERAFNTSF